jgi:hypothetical protein
MHVAEFTLHAKPGHFDELAELYSAFARDFLSTQPELETVLVLGDEGQGIVRGIGIFDEEAAGGPAPRKPVGAGRAEASPQLRKGLSHRPRAELRRRPGRRRRVKRRSLP